MWTRGRVLSGLYVAAVAVLAASAFWTPNATFTWDREAVAMVLTLPALIPSLPVIYVVGAGMWNLTDATNGGPMWPVTLAFTLMFSAAAVANVLLLRSMLRAWRSRRGSTGAVVPR